ncbi:molybdopterin-dependent oxidoreductase [Terasakiella sp. A23]|uniref:molybdopterin-dependent oxidoreductase n=1 Tax=Terasakiella sp. FCG-A23 TaxID=3080561 RepID=UPI002953DF79|nr:molybdopterin-dependent oxidoreductase [Terasakiella sp. A23]MDV7341495.1 molybdopterin-dependent oxidoreductase [Terasakiella sp. A23]
MNRISLMIDLERCTGCKSCEAACKQTNRLGPQEYRNRVMWLGDPNVPSLDFLTVTCQQCERPACLRACPVVPKAIYQEPETGVIRINEDRCTGCGECVLSCPYGAMGYDPVDHHAVKCDLCASRREIGDGPACASVCPTKAITFGKVEDHLKQADQTNRIVRDHDHFLQKPSTVYLDLKEKREISAEQDSLGNRDVPQIMKDDETRRRIGSKNVHGPYRQEKEDVVADRIVPGGCNICFNGCTVKFHLKGDQVVNIYGNDEDPVFGGRICPKSQMTLQLYDNPQRLTRPLKRTGPRGSGQFVEISWDQALDEIAEKLEKMRTHYGSEALAIHMGTRVGILTILGYMPMFAQLWGTPNTSTTEAFCDGGKVVSLELTQGSTNLANVYSEDDIGSAELYVYIGDNQAETRPVNFGMVNDWRLKNDAELIVVDPRLTATASKADEWLAIRPGTDMALGLALIHHLFESNGFDKAFCEAWVLGWKEWRDFIFEKGYSPKWAEEITGLAADQIKRLGDKIAQADGCMLFASRGVNQHTNSTQTNRVLMFLAAITGNWGRKGGGYFNVAAESDWKTVPVPADRKAPMMQKGQTNSPSGWIDAMMGQGDYPIKAVITGNNPLAQWPNQNAAREALKQLDLLVHIDLFKNETSMLADYVLPATTGIEKGGPSRLAEDRRIVWNDKRINPPGDAKSDHWFWVELGKRFGFEDVLKEEFKDPAVFWDDVFRIATPDLNGVSIERLRRQPYRWVRPPVAHEDAPEQTTLYLEGTTAFGQSAGKRFATPSGKLEFWTADIERHFQALGLSSLPEFYSETEQLIDLPFIRERENAESVQSPFFKKPMMAVPSEIISELAETPGQRLRDKGFDTELVTGRPPAPHFHSWTHNFWQAQEMWPDLYCQIHPIKAKELGVKDGETVKVTTESGEIEARAWITTGIRETAVYIPIGWDQKQPFHPAKSVNFLTSNQRDPISYQNNLKIHLCRVRRVDQH